MMRRMPRATATRAVVVALALMTRATVANAGFTLAPTSDASAPGVTYAGSASFRAVTRDACGTCAGDGARCRGCDGVANSGTVFDACGGCGTACDRGSDSSCVFNSTCVDCAGNTDGNAVADACGTCATPTSETFSRAGVPNYHLGGCVGCDGVPNSGAVLDECGVCGGNGCAGDDPSLWGWCCDCAGVAFGKNTRDLCCVCVDSESYYPNGVKPDAHVRIESLWKQGQRAFGEAQALMEDFKTLPFPKARIHARDLYAEAKQAYDDAWALVEQQRASDTTMCYPTPSSQPAVSNAQRDACGVCGGQLDDCGGCTIDKTPVGPLGGSYPDDCGVCDAEGELEIDVCGVCQGTSDGSTCLGCDGIIASGKVQDACFGSSDPRMDLDPNAVGQVGSGCTDPVEFKTACDAGGAGCCGCDGVPNSGKTLDACGTCLAANAAERQENANLCTRIYLVKLLNGVIIGPYTGEQIESGSLQYFEASTDEETTYTIQPDSLIANAAEVEVVESLVYGETSVEQEYLDSWQSIYVTGRDDIINSTSDPNSDNTVFVRSRRVTNTSDYEELQVKVEFIGVIYPFCTGSTYRRTHRLHGKKTDDNYLGIYTNSEGMPDDWESARGRKDQAWNDFDERIFDSVEEWADQRCTCAADWRTDPEPVPPTCERVWLDSRFSKTDASMERSAASGSWKVSGGWWTQDYGQKTKSTQTTARGPRRIDSFGTLRTQTSASDDEGTRELGTCDYKAMRVIDDTQNVTGAFWHPQRQEVTRGFNVTFKFMVTQSTQTCDFVQSVSGAFVQSIHTTLYEKCVTTGGDGFAFVIRDDKDDVPDATDLGAGGPFLGYGGIPYSIAFEFDTVYTPDFEEPRESHVAIHTRGKSANTAHASASLASVALDGSISDSSINDGLVHEVHIRYTPDISVDDMFFAIESGEITGLSTALSSHTADTLGILAVHLDDAVEPLMSVPFAVESILRDGHTDAWVGFTASSGELWQAVDVLEWSVQTPP